MIFILEGLLFIAVCFIVVFMVLKAIEMLNGDD
jgi:uncharacterized membrane protein YhdT